MKADEVKRAMTTKQKKRGLDGCQLLSTGSTLLNLAMTGRPDGGWLMGL